MPNIKRLTDLSAYKSVLPYASELFGVYQPLIGWKSKRLRDRIRKGLVAENNALLSRLARHLGSRDVVAINADCAVTAPGLSPATYAGPTLIEHDSVVLREISALLSALPNVPPTGDDWRQVLNPDRVTDLLRTKVIRHYNSISMDNCRLLEQLTSRTVPATDFQQRQRYLRDISHREIRQQIYDETSVAGVLVILAQDQRFKELNRIFFTNLDVDSKKAFHEELERAETDVPEDPYLTFDPKKDLEDNVSLSPLGIVHLYRQYFFELDTFLGTPTGHVWLSPGSSVELIEISTRKVITEKTIALSIETALKSEKSTTSEEEISEAVKQDNRQDLKLGVSTTATQSWGTGSASATASLNMDRTQQVARESSHKRMRQQSEKLSSELRQNYTTTFKTITETTDTSSKRYLLANNGQELINYELRRKMRQVAVQVQDIGSYLCWETFVDEPGAHLGLAHLVHLAQPADLLPVPDQTDIPYPADRLVPFQTKAEWNFGDARKFGFVTVGFTEPPPAPEGFEVVLEPGIVPVTQITGTGEDFTGVWGFGGRFTPSGQLEIGVITGPDGLEWSDRVDFVVGGALRYTVTGPKKAEIDNANKTRKVAANEASAANDRKTKDAFVKAVQDRVEKAAAIVARPFEELREEERIIVYRKLIESLMSGYQYRHATDRSRHLLAELINSVFDVDKMLYFVAPEWWKPRERPSGYLSVPQLQEKLSDSLVSWSDSRTRPDNYLITDKSDPAVLGSSLGWLLQLDGDSLRNAFLNAPWVKAVVPVRPGKEQAALAWLQNVQVEGADGLDAKYEAAAAELSKIRTALGLAANAVVSLRQAIQFLCNEVAAKHAKSNEVTKFPETEIDDANKVSATPIEKVYEHGFYPLKGGFRVDPTAQDPDPNNTDRHFQIFDQWIEVLPTDQVVPVPVKYNPLTGRQIPVP